MDGSPSSQAWTWLKSRELTGSGNQSSWPVLIFKVSNWVILMDTLVNDFLHGG